jgi:hypothetical protein
MKATFSKDALSSSIMRGFRSERIACKSYVFDAKHQEISRIQLSKDQKSRLNQ